MYIISNMSIAILILAGGVGKRMKSPIPKVLHKINEYSILGNIIKKISDNLNNDILVVTGKYHPLIKETLQNELGKIESNINYVNQPHSLGTGHALQCSFDSIKKYYGVIVINGDIPFINMNKLSEIINNYKKDSLLGICQMPILQPEYQGHGRIILSNGQIRKIVEAKDCNEEEIKINIINGGLYYFRMDILSKFINKLDNNNKQQEYYITDFIDLFVDNNHHVLPIFMDKNDILNINTPEQLTIAKNLINNI